jgi:hypothetical protein
MDRAVWAGLGEAAERGARERRRAELRTEIIRLEARRARSNDPKTKQRLSAQIERAQGRLGRA